MSEPSTQDGSVQLDEVAQLEAELNRLVEAREARESEAQKSERVAALKKKITDEHLAAREADLCAGFEAQLGPENKAWRKVRSMNGHGIVVVKKPNPITFRKYQDMGKTDCSALENLVRPCLASCTKDEFDEILKDEPALLVRVANAVAFLAGARKEQTSGE